jgi:hypothetical protein
MKFLRVHVKKSVGKPDAICGREIYVAPSEQLR